MDIPASELYDTSVALLFEGGRRKFTFPVTSNEGERLQRILDARRGDPCAGRLFLVFSTLNGWDVAVRVAAVDCLRVLIDPTDIAPVYEPAPECCAHCYFVGAEEPLDFCPAFPEEAAALVTTLDAETEPPDYRFLSIRDEDAEWLHLALERLNLILFSSALIAAGHQAIRDEVDNPN